MTNIAQFIHQVRQEASKVTWSTKKEVISSTIMVLVLVVIFSLFFLAVDSIVLRLVSFLLGM